MADEVIEMERPVGHVIKLSEAERAAIRALSDAIKGGRAIAFTQTQEAIRAINQREVAPLVAAYQQHIQRLASELNLTVNDNESWQFDADAMRFRRVE